MSPLTARGTVVKSGRTLAVAEGEVFQGEKIVAKAVVTFAVM
jgi:acyl-coenzyme A thioesterase PaaI-like protein